MGGSGASRVRVGVLLPLLGLGWEELRARAALIERLGYDALWLDDHFWFPGAPDRDHLDVWTALSALAVTTSRIDLGPLVLCQSYRAPAVVAKMAASLAAVSGDRLVLGLGAGWMEEEYRAYGFDFPPPRVRVEQLGELLEILRRLWSEERASFAGRHHRVVEAPCRPKPKRLPIVVGGAGERLLGLVARHADGWNCPNPNWRELAAKRAALLRHCAAIGRDPAEIEVCEQVMVVVGRTAAEVRRERALAEERLRGFAKFDGDCHVGTPAEVAASLGERCRLGVQAFAVMFGDYGGAEQVELFAREVVPLLDRPARDT